MTEASLLLFAPSAYPLGGVASWIDYLLPGLRARGWRPTLAVTQGRHHDPQAYLTAHPYSPAVSVSCGVGTQAARVRQAAETIRAQAPDIVAFVNLPEVALAVQRLRWRRAFAGKLVWIEHGLDRQSMMDALRLQGAIDGFVATNQLGAELARRFARLAPARVLHAPYGVATMKQAPSPRPPSGKLRLLYAGRLDAEQKRVHDLPRLADELMRRGVAFRLIVAGAGPEEAALRRSFAGSPHDVIFLGAVSQQALHREVLPDADALIILSSWETGPLIAYEAMTAGVPVATSRFLGSQAEGALVDAENCLMFPIGDMRAAASALTRLCEPATRERLVGAGRALVAARYSHQASVARWDQALCEVLALPALPPQVEPERIAPAGRLERWLGPRAGERLSAALGRAYRHREPGGEWPHWLARSGQEREAYDLALSLAETGRRS